MNAQAAPAPVAPGYGVKGVNPGLMSGNATQIKRAQSSALMQMVEEQNAAKSAKAQAPGHNSVISSILNLIMGGMNNAVHSVPSQANPFGAKTPQTANSYDWSTGQMAPNTGGTNG